MLQSEEALQLNKQLKILLERHKQVPDIPCSEPLDLQQNQDSKKRQAVSNVYSLTYYAEQYKSPQQKQKINELSKEMSSYREVRGDGNCFYRGLGFSYLEHLFLSQDNLREFTQRLGEIKKQKQQLKNCFFDESKNKQQINVQKYFAEPYAIKLNDILYYYLMVIVTHLQGKHILDQEQYNSEVKQTFFLAFNNNELFDLLVVEWIRCLVAENLREKKNEFAQFMLEEQNIEQIIMDTHNYGEDGQGLQIKASADALNINLIIYYFDKNTTNEVNYLPESEVDATQLKKIILFFRPGHYDIGYLKENQANQQKQNQVILKQEQLQINQNCVQKLPQKMKKFNLINETNPLDSCKNCFRKIDLKCQVCKKIKCFHVSYSQCQHLICEKCLLDLFSNNLINNTSEKINCQQCLESIQSNKKQEFMSQII